MYLDNKTLFYNKANELVKSDKFDPKNGKCLWIIFNELLEVDYEEHEEEYEYVDQNGNEYLKYKTVYEPAYWTLKTDLNIRNYFKIIKILDPNQAHIILSSFKK